MERNTSISTTTSLWWLEETFANRSALVERMRKASRVKYEDTVVAKSSADLVKAYILVSRSNTFNCA
jgi:hypothetical protein